MATDGLSTDEARRRELLAAALERLDEEGEAGLDAFLHRHPGDAAGLRERIALLGDSGLLEAGADDELDRIPERLGEFRLKRRLGSGGMGVVYLAEQTSLGRDVALKLIRPEHVYFPQARVRFRREIEAAAQLQHPAIVRVYAAGQHGGLPYFTMERVDGIGLDALLRELKTALGGAPPSHLDENVLRATLARLGGAHGDAAPNRGRSWVEVCSQWLRDLAEAVDHAHRHGVLHRDIKPSNVMVTWSGRVMLLDFGLASMAAGAAITRSSVRLGSLPYMAPEQVRGEADRIDTRTDVYALGVTLYEALTLASPFGDASSTDEEVRQRIVQALPTPLRQRNPAVSRDVETVCAVAMAPESHRRYAGAADLARDLQNVLDLRPIEARRPTAGTRLRRLVRRHPVASVTASLSFLLLIVAPSIVAAREYRLRTQIAAAKEETEREAGTRIETLRFLNEDLLAAVAPGEAGKDASMRSVLDLAAQRIEGRFPDRPLVEAAIRDTLGDTYRRLGFLEEAERHLTRALELLSEHEGAEARSTLSAQRRLAIVLLALGRLQDAEDLDRRSLRAARAAFGDEDPDTLAAANNLGLCLTKANEFPEAEALLRDVVERRLRLLGEQHSHTLTSMNNLGMVYTNWGKYEAALHWTQRELELCRRLQGDDHPETLASRNNYATLLQRLGRFEEALAILEALVPVSKKVRGESHPYTINNLNNVALALASLGRYDEADARWQEALDCARDQPPDSRQVLRLRLWRGDALRRNRKFAEAATMLAPAVEVCRRALGDDDAMTLFARAAQAAWLEDTGRLEEAAAGLGAAIAAADARQPTEAARTRLAQARVLTALGRHADAESCLEQAVGFFTANAPWDAALGDALRALAQSAQARLASADAAAWRERLQRWQESSAPTRHGY